MASEGQILDALVQAGQKFSEARTALDEAKGKLDAALVAADNLGMFSEYKLATLAGVNRLTVRRAVGKRISTSVRKKSSTD
jgi:hypothetical protein